MDVGFESRSKPENLLRSFFQLCYGCILIYYRVFIYCYFWTSIAIQCVGFTSHNLSDLCVTHGYSFSNNYLSSSQKLFIIKISI